MNKIRENETNDLKDLLEQEKMSKKREIEKYNEKLNKNNELHQQEIMNNEKKYTERIDQMSNTIHDLNSKIYSLKAEHEVDLKKKDEGYEKKFREIDQELRTKFEEIKNNNDKLTNELNTRQKLEEYKFIHLDQEHEQEINYKNEKFETIIAKMEKEKLSNQGEISTLNNEKKKLLKEKEKLENEIKHQKEEIERHIKNIESLRKANEMKEQEKEELKRKLKESEGILQEKSKLAGFSSKLKNELYIKNVEIMSKFNKQQIENTELKETSKNIEKELDENIRLLANREKEIRKNQILLEEYKEKYERERHNAKLIEKDFDNLLQKIYDTFQSNDKNVIIKGIRKIYNIYLTSDVVKKIDSSKLNVNIRDELTKQIDFLQKGILNITETKNRRESNQNSEIFKKTRENGELIKQLNAKKKAYSELEKEFHIVKSDLSALKKKFEQIQREQNMKENNVNKQQIINENLPQLSKQINAEKDNNFNKTLYQMNNMNGLSTVSQFNNTQKKFNMTTTEKKSWKDTKLYKGNSLSSFRENRNDAYKMSEIKKKCIIFIYFK